MSLRNDGAGVSAATDMRLVSNSSQSSHRRELLDLLDGADEILISVAFLRSRGLDAVHSQLGACLRSGGRVRIHAGLDFRLTDPEALDRLAKLVRRWPGCNVFLASAKGATFHPKAYLARSGGKYRALIGSANLTGGALDANEELSIRFEGTQEHGLVAQLLSWFSAIEQGGRLEPISALRLLNYRDACAKAREIAERIQREIKSDVLPPLDLRALNTLFGRYRSSGDEQTQRESRRAARLEALKLQNEIAALGGKRLGTRQANLVRSHLRDLMGSQGARHLWHSHAIFRQGSRALDYPDKLATLFLAAKGQARRMPEQAYEALREHALTIPGVGVNMITEILSTVQPSRFPVFNGNTAGALRALGLQPASLMSKQAFRGWHYARVEEALAAVGSQIGAADFLTVDAFLNYVYFETEARNGEVAG